jgi:hypothetical protein
MSVANYLELPLNREVRRVLERLAANSEIRDLIELTANP